MLLATASFSSTLGGLTIHSSADGSWALSLPSPDDGDEEALLALVRQAARHAIPRGIDYLMVGLAARNPLAKVLEKRLYCHKYASMIYVVYWDDGREIASTIDNRIPQPEVAIL